MSQISISISTEFRSTIEARIFNANGEQSLLTVDIHTNIPSGYMKDGTQATQVFAKDIVQFHGTLADLQLMADRIVAAVYPEKCQPDVDAKIDAEREADATSIPGPGDVEIPAAAYIDGRNAAVADPLRGIINAISPAISPDVTRGYSIPSAVTRG